MRSALFFCRQGMLKMPVSIITRLKVDNEGYIWFFVKRPFDSILAFNKEFSAHLNFFREGKNFSLEIIGKGSIVDEPEKVNNLVSLDEEIKQKAMLELMLLKLKIIDAYYFEYLTATAKGKYWFNASINKIYNWLFAKRMRLAA